MILLNIDSELRFLLNPPTHSAVERVGQPLEGNTPHDDNDSDDTDDDDDDANNDDNEDNDDGEDDNNDG